MIFLLPPPLLGGFTTTGYIFNFREAFAMVARAHDEKLSIHVFVLYPDASVSRTIRTRCCSNNPPVSKSNVHCLLCYPTQQLCSCGHHGMQQHSIGGQRVSFSGARDCGSNGRNKKNPLLL